MHLVEEEYRARRQRREAKTSIRAESKALADWLRTEHPRAPRLTPKTIENKLRADHRQNFTKARK
jgi:uncharacterized membrane protein YkvA (DUF1232 family)